MVVKKDIRVLFAISNLTYGGIQTQSLTLAKEFKKRGVKVYFFFTNKIEESFVDKEIFRNGFKLINGRFIESEFWKNYSWRLQRYLPLLRLICLIRYYRIDYIIPYQNKLNYYFGAVHNFSGAKRTIFHLRNAVAEDKPKRNWYLLKALKNKPLIIANSDHARIKFIQIYGKSFNLDIHTIQNGIKINPINNSINWKKHFDVDSYSFIVSMVANFFTEKDFLTVFKAWGSFIKETKSNSILLVAGDEGVSGLKKCYFDMVKELNLDKHIKFLGRIPHTNELISIVDCNILSSFSEGLPNIVIETLALGKPFVGSNIEGIKEVVGKDYPISLFEKKDCESLKEILLKIYHKEVDLPNVKKYSLQRSKKFTVEKLVNGYLNLIPI